MRRAGGKIYQHLRQDSGRFVSIILIGHLRIKYVDGRNLVGPLVVGGRWSEYKAGREGVGWERVFGYGENGGGGRC